MVETSKPKLDSSVIFDDTKPKTHEVMAIIASYGQTSTMINYIFMEEFSLHGNEKDLQNLIIFAPYTY